RRILQRLATQRHLVMRRDELLRRNRRVFLIGVLMLVRSRWLLGRRRGMLFLRSQRSSEDQTSTRQSQNPDDLKHPTHRRRLSRTLPKIDCMVKQRPCFMMSCELPLQFWTCNHGRRGIFLSGGSRRRQVSVAERSSIHQQQIRLARPYHSVLLGQLPRPLSPRLW